MKMTKLLLFIAMMAAASVAAFAGENVEVTSKPLPMYTDAARSRKVQGTVELKVTFNADGSIGAVQYVGESSKKKKLTKYGLVAEAINAAWKIRFTPAKDDAGNPVTVTKTVEYRFTLY